MSKIKKILTLLIICFMILSLNSVVFGTGKSITMNRVGAAGGRSVYKITFDDIIWFCGERGEYLKASSRYVKGTATTTTKTNYLAYIFSFYNGISSSDTDTNILGGTLKSYTSDYLNLQKIIWSDSGNEGLNKGQKYSFGEMDSLDSSLQTTLTSLKTYCEGLKNKAELTDRERDELQRYQTSINEAKTLYNTNAQVGYGDEETTKATQLSTVYSKISRVKWADDAEERNYYIAELYTAIDAAMGTSSEAIKEADEKASKMYSEGKTYDDYTSEKQTQISTHGHIYTPQKPTTVATNVDRQKKYFIVGEYKIDYVYRRIEDSVLAGDDVLLSGIVDIEVRDQNGILINGVEFLDATSGKVINDGSDNYQYPKPGEKFNVKVPYRDDENGISSITIKVDFRYIDSITSTFTRQNLTAYTRHSGCVLSDEYHNKYSGDVQDLLVYNGSDYEWKEDSLIITDEPEPDDPTWNFEIEKLDIENDEPIDDTKFNIKITNEDTGKEIYNRDRTTNSNGIISITDLEARRDKKDEYTIEIEEIEANEDYKKSNVIKKISLTIDNGKIVDNADLNSGGEFEDEEDVYVKNKTINQTLKAELYNEPNENDFQLKIIKIDDKTGAKLKGAEFDIEIYNQDNTDTPIFEDEKTTNSNGKITVEPDLTDGDYRVFLKETKTPTGYRRRVYATSIEFTIENGIIDIDDEDDYDPIVMKQQTTSGSSYKTVSNKEEYLEVDNNTRSNSAELTVYIENYDTDSRHYYEDEGYNIILTKSGINPITDEKTGEIKEDSINFTIELKKNGKSITTWDKTTQNAQIEITYKMIENAIDEANVSMTGDFELHITENLKTEQQKIYSPVGNNKKVIKYKVESKKKTEGRTTTTYYYIDDTIATSGGGVIVDNTTEPIVDDVYGIKTLEIEVENYEKPGVETTIRIAGTVFEDCAGIKANKNGYMDGSDEKLAGIEVTLLYEDGSKVQKKANGDDLKNPIYTKSDGSYEFAKLDAMKKYRVKFAYNGQEYMATDYFKGADEKYSSYNQATDEYYADEVTLDEEYLWESYSKAIEQAADRNELNGRFATIGSYIEGSYEREDKTKNTAYPKTTMAKIYEFIQNKAAEDEDLSDRNAIKQYLIDHGITDMSMYDVIQEEIDYMTDIIAKIDAGEEEGDRDYWVRYIDILKSYRIAQNITENSTSMYTIDSMLQYAEDCKIESYTDVYPTLDQFVVSDKTEVVPVVSVDQTNGTYTSGVQTSGGTVFKALYGNREDENGNQIGGVRQINFGIYERPTVELVLYEDIYDTTVTINNKTTVYDYYEGGELYDGSNNKVKVYEADYAAYEAFVDSQAEYRTYEQDVRSSDFAGNGSVDATDLEIYVKYKIEISNQHNSEVMINSLINHYDSRYFRYIDDGKCGAYAIDANGNQVPLNVEELNNQGDYTKYGTDPIYKQLKITLKNAKTLTTGTTPQEVYITLKLTDAQSTSSALRELLPNGNEGDSSIRLRNYTEVYSYSTNTNSAETKGLVDRSSIAGNFMPGTGINELDNSNAPNQVFKVVPPRTLEGNVYEDTSVTDASKISNAKTKSDSIAAGEEQTTINNVRVDLVELVPPKDEFGDIINNGSYDEVIRQTDYTKDNGVYKFEGYIPGDYVVKFTYGNFEKDANGNIITTTDTITKGANGNKQSYNGQDYQSTYANPYTDDRKYWYAKNENEQILTESTPTYENRDDDYSDAYDEVGARTKAITYATTAPMNGADDIAINYYKSQVLKAGNVYNGDDDLKKALSDSTAMTAYTSKLELEVELANINQIYHQIYEENGDTDRDDLTYAVKEIDFGLVRRAPSELTLEKRVKHILITQSDGTELVNSDVTISEDLFGNDVISLDTDSDKVHFQSIGTQNANGIVTAKLEVDDEIIVGTIDITYEFTITNNTENTTLTYYKDNVDNLIAIGYYTTGTNGYTGNEKLNQIVYNEKVKLDGDTLEKARVLVHENGVAKYIECANRDNPAVEDVKTQAVDIIDYVSNNLRFDSDKNNGWDLVTKSVDENTDVISGMYANILFRTDKNSLLAAEARGTANGIYSNISENVNTYNQILLASSGNALLEPFTEKYDKDNADNPKASRKFNIVLSTSQTTDVDLDYTNVAEIIQTTNSAGRADASSIPGNLDPIKDYLVVYEETNPNYFNSRQYNEQTDNDGIYGLLKQDNKKLYPDTKLDELKDDGKAFELDSTKAQQVSITDSTGDTHYYYVLIGSMLAIFALGIAGIKKFVLDKKE